ncbi:G-patch DNA repair protein [Phyllosticta citricarpa]|uniref:G-patch DNA repair protein n=1 Tax=Phyllosticta citricarpa TaxID=55181 RepID=A0ABR1MSR2_9PEZI
MHRPGSLALDVGHLQQQRESNLPRTSFLTPHCLAMAQEDNAKNAQPRGLSSFANLLGSNASTISSAPVLYAQQPSSDDAPKDEAAAKKQQINSAALRFQPTKRPQLASQKKPKKPGATGLQSSSSPDPSNKPAAPKVVALAANPPSKTTFADWTADDGDMDGFYTATQHRERGGRKKKKKKKKQQEQEFEQNWDDIYDPTRPNDYSQYRGSEEQMREINEWKEHLHRFDKRADSMDYSSSEDEGRRPRMNAQFAPPKSLNFAPPSSLNAPPPPPPVPAAPAEIPDDPTGEDAYARRMRLSGMAGNPPPPEVEDEPESTNAPPPPPPPPEPTPSATISRAPVRYELPPAPAGLPATEEEMDQMMDEDEDEPASEAAPEDGDGPRSRAPGQKGFAQRLMQKYGWEKGKGLGAKETGIVTPLQMQAQKRKKKSDAEGGGWAAPKGMGKIVGGKRVKVEEENSPYPALSEVIVLFHMVDGMDVEKELQEGVLVQEIGEECGAKYGRVEQVRIDKDTTADTIPVFIKFTSQMSALRAVNALDGRIFNGNKISARYFDSARFANGDLEMVVPESEVGIEKEESGQ